MLDSHMKHDHWTSKLEKPSSHSPQQNMTHLHLKVKGYPFKRANVLAHCEQPSLNRGGGTTQTVFHLQSTFEILSQVP